MKAYRVAQAVCASSSCSGRPCLSMTIVKTNAGGSDLNTRDDRAFLPFPTGAFGQDHHQTDHQRHRARKWRKCILEIIKSNLPKTSGSACTNDGSPSSFILSRFEKHDAAAKRAPMMAKVCTVHQSSSACVLWERSAPSSMAVSSKACQESGIKQLESKHVGK